MSKNLPTKSADSTPLKVALTELNDIRYRKLSAEMNMSAAQIVNDILDAAYESNVVQQIVVKFKIENDDGLKTVIARKESRWKVKI